MASTMSRAPASSIRSTVSRRPTVASLAGSVRWVGSPCPPEIPQGPDPPPEERLDARRTRPRRRHRSRRPDRLQPALPHRQRRPARPRSAGDPPAARDHAGPRRARRRGHGARRLRLPAARRHGADRRRRRRLRRRRTSRCSSAPGPAPRAWSGPTCSRPTAPSSPCRARRCPTRRPTTCKILVVGNPANTNALIAMNNAPEHRPRAVHRHDPPRPQPGHGPAGRQGRRARVNDITKMTIWGNHSATQYPDLFHAEVGGKNAAEVVGDQAWLENDVHPHRAAARRGDHRGPGRRRRASARQRRHRPRAAPGSPAPPTATGCRWRVPSDGSYGVPEGLMSSFPCTTKDGDVGDRPGPRHRRLLPRPHRRLRRRAGRGARHRHGPRPHLAVRLPTWLSRSRLLQELAGRVVGQHLAAGLAGGAVVDRVGAVLDRPDRVAADRARLALAVVDGARAAPSTSSCRRGCARRRATRRCRRRWPRPAARPRRRSSFAALANGDSLARWQISLASRRPRPAMQCWSRRNPCSRVECAVSSSRQRRRGRPGRRRGRGRSSGSWVSGSPLTTHTPALRSVPASVSSRARPSAKHPAGHAAPGLGRLLLVGLEPAALHEVDDEGGRAEVEQQVLAPPADEDQRRGRRPPRAAGTAVFSAVKRDRPEAWPARCRRTSASSRSAWAWTSGSSGISTRCPPARASNTSSTPSKVPWWVISSSTSPPTRSLPIMNAVWADSSPRPMAAAVS